jgi:hypothetical protein
MTAALRSVPEGAADQYATCRALGHAWDVLGVERKRPGGGRVWTRKLELRCTRCTMTRLDALDAWGDVVQNGRQYRQPPGYRYPRGQVPTRAEFRLMMLGARRPRGRRST